MFKNISPDSVRSGRTCPANLGVRSGHETHMPSPVEPGLEFQKFFSITRPFFLTVGQNNFGNKIPFLTTLSFVRLLYTAD